MLSLDQFYAQVMKLYDEKNYAGALNLIDAQVHQFPEEVREGFRFFEANVCALGNQTDRAIAVLQDALEHGQWFPEVRLRHPDLANLQGLPAFESVVADCKERHAAAQAEAGPLRITVPPVGTPQGLLMTLHGAPGKAQPDRAQWAPAAEQEWAVALLQSSQVLSPEGFHWLNRESTASEVRTHYDELAREYPAARDNLLLGGFSQGAASAAWLTLTRTVPARGFIAVCPGTVVWQQTRAMLESAQVAGLRAFIIAGEKDHAPHREAATEMADLINRLGGTAHLEVVPGLGHAFPPDFAAMLVRALAFVAGA